MIDRMKLRNAVNVPIEDGKHYVNGRGDVVGPMRQHRDFFWDQHDRVYHPDGRQWDHVPDSTGNIVAVLAQGSESA